MPSHRGSTSDIHGTYVTSMSTASSTTSHGSAACTTRVTGSSAMPDVTNRFKPDRRRDHADLHVDGHDDAEMHGMDAELRRDREHDRREDQHDRRRFHEAARDEQQQVQHDQERPTAAGRAP